MVTLDDKINIVLASDERYFVGLLVTSSSIARHAAADALLSFTILDGGIAEASKRELIDSVRRFHGKSEIRFAVIDLSRFDGLPSLAGNAMTYARLLLPQLLKEDEFALYCDVDFLWRGDVAELWRLRDCTLAVQSTPETFGPTLGGERQWAETHGIGFPAKGYFCAGMCLMNLKMFRERELDRLVLEFLANHRDVAFHDQSALNFALSESGSPVGMLPRKWQVFTHDVTDDDVRGDFVLHFAGNTPWAPVRIFTDAEMLWYRELALVRGVSTWQALRMIHSGWRIVFGRAAFALLTISVCGFRIASLAARMIGQPASVGIFRRLPKSVYRD